ncbi:hypothetical protein FRC09_016327, partial [Ceratobasidium sp. 395]
MANLGKSATSEANEHGRAVSIYKDITVFSNTFIPSPRLRQFHLKYGPIVSLKIGSGTLISIGGDGTQIRQLLDKRGAIYSGRPLQMSTEIAGKGDYLLFQQDTNKWRSARKQIVQHFAPNVMKAEHFPVQEAESVQLLYDFLHEPEGFMHHPMR